MNKEIDWSRFHKAENMDEVQNVFKKIFDGRKTYGTDTIKMGFFMGEVLTAKVMDNVIMFALPYNGPIGKLQEILETTRYDRYDTIMVRCEISDDNTLLTATFYSKEFKLFWDD